MVDDRFAITFDGNHGNGIVGSFCGNLNLAVDEIARLVKRLGTSEFSSYLDDAYGAACAERSPAEIAVAILGEMTAQLRKG